MNSIPQDATSEKQCSKCKQWKPATLEYFVPNRPSRRTYSLLSAECKECKNASSRQKYTLTHPTESVPEGYKRCPKCENEYPATTEYFGTDKWAKDKLTFRCRTCKNAAQKLVKPTGRKTYQFDPNIVAYKRCPECKQEKLVSLENFLPDNHAKYGVSYVCKVCWKPYAERLAKERAAKPQEPMRTCTGPCGKTFPATTEYFFREGPGLCTRCKWCRVKQGRLNYKLNEGVRKAHRRIYIANNLEMVRASSRNWHARRRNAPGRHTGEDIQDQLKRQKHKCYWCGKKLGTGKRAYHVDHVIPLTREGTSNDPWNLVIACHTCNERRQNKLPHEWPEGGRLL